MKGTGLQMCDLWTSLGGGGASRSEPRLPQLDDQDADSAVEIALSSSTLARPGPQPLPALLSGRYLQPLNVVLGLLGNELDALEDVGDVVDAPLLHLQHLCRPVQVNNAIS